MVVMRISTLELFSEFFRLCLFKICSHIFVIFEFPNRSSDFGHAETGSGTKKKKSEWFCGGNIFCSNLKIE